MNKKQEYLDSIKEILENKEVINDDINQIISDYSDLYDQALEQNLSHEEIVKKLGDARSIYHSLKADLNYKKDYESSFGSKLTGLMVFVSLIIFFVLGLGFQAWNYAWLVFLLIPVTAILTSVKGKDLMPALSVFIAVPTFFLLGMFANLWHPGWLVFLLIPISGVLTTSNKTGRTMGLIPFLTVISYFLISSIYSGFYLYGWPIFLTIPLIGSLFIKNKFKRILIFSSLLLSIIGYYILSISLDNWKQTAYIFALPLVIGLFTKQITISVDLPNKNSMKYYIGLFVVLLAYFLVSILMDGWKWTWVILLLYPMYAIFLTTKFKSLTPYSPFIAVIIFYLVGYFVQGGFKFSWLAFFLIPISGILFESVDKEIEETSSNDED